MMGSMPRQFSSSPCLRVRATTRSTASMLRRATRHTRYPQPGRRWGKVSLDTVRPVRGRSLDADAVHATAFRVVGEEPVALALAERNSQAVDARPPEPDGDRRPP